jgi:hypothetical protein
LQSACAYARFAPTSYEDEPDALIEEQMADLRGRVATLQLQGVAAGARVLVDGAALGIAPLPRPLRVASGRHILRVERRDAAPFEATIDAAAQQTLVVNAAPPPIAAATEFGPAELAPALDKVTGHEPRGRPAWTWLAAGSTVALGAATAVFGVLATTEYDRIDKRLAACPACDPEAALRDQSSARRMQTLCNVFLAATAAAGVAGITLFTLERHASEPATTVQLGPGTLRLSTHF